MIQRLFNTSVVLGLSVGAAVAAENAPAPRVEKIDLPTALRLAGAQNVDVQIAKERVSEARAQHESARLQYFPWLTTGAGYRRHDGQIQAVDGAMLDTSKQSYNVGGTITAQLDLGEAIYKSLAARQLADAAGQGLRARQQDAVLNAASRYFELSEAQAAIAVATESVHLSEEYLRQVEQAASAGIAFKGDVLRVRVQAERNRQSLEAARSEQRVAAARLAQVLKLDLLVVLEAVDIAPVPVKLAPDNAALDSLVVRALATRPEMLESHHVETASMKAQDAATRGPLIPTIGAQAFVGGLGGGYNNSWGNFSDSEDYFLGLTWRIGPGGLFDRTRIRATEARRKTSELQTVRLRDQIVAEVVEQHTRTQSLETRMKQS
ncbi:MAG TPA: TolC family protein, partial [Roseimicrobium sp.]|nr:TolC family protein [Roseimicrobium sp.]